MTINTPPHDNDKLRIWMQADPHERRGVRLVHLHLSLVEPSTAVDHDAITRSLTALGQGDAHIRLADKSDTAMTMLRRLQILRMSNADIVMVYKGLHYSAIERVCKKIADDIGSAGKIVGVNAYGESSLYSILDLAWQLTNVTRYLDGIGVKAGS